MRRFGSAALLGIFIVGCGGGGSSTGPPPNPIRPVYPVTELLTADDQQISDDLLNNYRTDVRNFHPLGLNADPVMIQDGSELRTWFSAVANINSVGKQGIASARSSDGIHWTDPKDINQWVKLDLVPAFDAARNVSYALETPYVLKLGATYYLYYARRLDDESAFDIRLATSTDGRVWVKVPGAVLSPMNTWEQVYTDANGLKNGGVLEPSVIYEPAGMIFKMWYSTLGLDDQGVWGGRIGYATSSDGINWSQNADPVFLPSASGWDSLLVGHSNVIKDPVQGYHLFYVGGASDNSQLQGIGHAYSDDGIHWTRTPQALIQKTANTWYATFVGGPSAIVQGGQVHIYFMGSDAPPDQMFSNVHFGRIEVDLASLRP